MQPFKRRHIPHLASGKYYRPAQSSRLSPIQKLQRAGIFLIFLMVAATLYALPYLVSMQLKTIIRSPDLVTTKQNGGQTQFEPMYAPAPPPLALTAGKIVAPANKVLTGLSLPEEYADQLPATDRLEQITGKKVSILTLYQAWGATNGAQNFNRTWMDTVRAHGSIPMVTWEPWQPQSQFADQPDYSLKNIIQGKFDSYITRWARDARRWNHPFFLRLAPEMNGTWSPWSEGASGNQPGEFIQAWRHVHDIFTANNVTGVTWVWCPNVNYSQSTPIAQSYPGDKYVDWTALDGFNWGMGPDNSWTDFKQVFAPTYQEMIKLAPGKPVMLAEVASAEAGGDKAAWITEGYSDLLPSYFTRVKAVVWFDQITHRDWRLDSSPGSLSAYTQAIKSNYYDANSFKDYQGQTPPGPKYYIAAGFQRPIVTLTFDDGWASQYTQAFQIMQWYNASGTFYLVPNFLNTPHYLTTNQAKQIEQAGNEIGSHTMNHMNLTELSPDNISQELTQSKQVLAAQFGPIKNFAAPFGAFNYQVTREVQQSYASDRTTELGFNNSENFNPYEIFSQNIYNTTTVAEINQWLDQAARQKIWLVFTFHQVDNSNNPYAITPQNFEAILASIRARDLPLLTLEQALEEIEPQLQP